MKTNVLRNNTAQARREFVALQQLARESRVTPEAEAHNLASIVNRQGRIEVAIENGEPVIQMLRHQGIDVSPLGQGRYQVLNKRVAAKPVNAVSGTNLGSMKVWDNWTANPEVNR